MKRLALLLLCAGCASGPGVGSDGGAPDAGTATDAGAIDSGPPDGGLDAGGGVDGGDAGQVDSGFVVGVVMNPALPVDFPDPFVLRTGGTFHGYATNITVGLARWNIPHARSTDLAHWTLVSDALPAVGAWADGSGYTQWAPSVVEVSPGFYVLYYVSKVAGTAGQQCIGRATSVSPDGPFSDSWTAPLVCNTAAPQRFWSIDPSPFRDANGALYLLWRQDDAAAGTNVFVQLLDPTGLSFAVGSTATRLLQHSAGTWEDPVTENPAMRFEAGTYFLFYSANRWDTAGYGVGYATCVTATGPCAKVTTQKPWLAAAGALQGPGGEDFFADPNGDEWMSLHGWVAPNVGYGDGGVRALWLYRFSVDAGVPVL